MRDNVLVNRNRIVVLCLILALVLAFGYLWFSMRGTGTDETAAPDAAETSGIPESLEPAELMPITEEQFDSALTVAFTHAAEYGTFEETDTAEDYYERLSHQASEGYSENMTNSWVAGVATELGAADQELTGEVTGIQATNISTTRVTFDVTVVARPPDDSTAEPFDIGEFTMTLEQVEDHAWEVSTASRKDAWHDDRSEEEPGTEADDA